MHWGEDGGEECQRALETKKKKKSWKIGGSTSITSTNCVFGFGSFTVIMPNCDAAWLRSCWLCCCSCTRFPICFNLRPVFWLCISVGFYIFLFFAPCDYYLPSFGPAEWVLRKWVCLVTELAAAELITMVYLFGGFQAPLNAECEPLNLKKMRDPEKNVVCLNRFI